MDGIRVWGADRGHMDRLPYLPANRTPFLCCESPAADLGAHFRPQNEWGCALDTDRRLRVSTLRNGKALYHIDVGNLPCEASRDHRQLAYPFRIAWAHSRPHLIDLQTARFRHLFGACGDLGGHGVHG